MNTLNTQDIQIKIIDNVIIFEKINKLSGDDQIAFYDFYYLETILNTYKEENADQVKTGRLRLSVALNSILPVVLIQEILEYYLFEHEIQIKLYYRSLAEIQFSISFKKNKLLFSNLLNPEIIWTTFRFCFENWINTYVHPRWISITTIEKLPRPNENSVVSCRVFGNLQQKLDDKFYPLLPLKRRTCLSNRKVIKSVDYIVSEFKNQDLLLKYCLNSENIEIWSYLTREKNQFFFKIIVRIFSTWTSKKTSFCHKK